jgi:hypothetical protein
LIPDAPRVDLEICPTPAEQAAAARSLPAAKVVPAFSISMGKEFYGKPVGFGEKLFEEYNSKHYHQPSDEYSEDWDFAGIEHIARFGFTLGLEVANMEKR